MVVNPYLYLWVCRTYLKLLELRLHPQPVALGLEFARLVELERHPLGARRSLADDTIVEKLKRSSAR